VEIDGVRYRRETNTMPQWAGSCWYYLRFIDPRNGRAMVDPEKERAWMPVDLYVGGAEHAVLHLLYARFWHKVLYDRGYVSTIEPFQRLVNQGMILGEMEYTGYRQPDGGWVSCQNTVKNSEGTLVDAVTGVPVREVKVRAEDAEKTGENFVLRADPSIRIDSRAFKMSKSRGNVVNPDEIVMDYGADSLRLYEMFMGPLEATKPWSMAGVNGVRNFLDRVWRMIVDDRSETVQLNSAVQDVEPDEEQNRVLHRTIREVTQDTATMDFNTPIARMMEFVNYFNKQAVRPKLAMERFVLLLSPYAPHIAEELWQVLGHGPTLAYEPWPQFDEALTRDNTIEIPVQVLGKLRSKVLVPAEATPQEIEAAARADEKTQEWIGDKQVVKVIVVPGRLINFVVKAN
jgi:leucyl-tRNA synthetase